MIDDGALTPTATAGTYAITHVGAGCSSSSKNVESWSNYLTPRLVQFL